MICTGAIEKYYGSNARDRFSQKEDESRKGLKELYDDPLWANFDMRIDKLMETFDQSAETEFPDELDAAGEVDVELDNKHYGRCPKCGDLFNYDEDSVGRLVRCRYCNLPLRLIWSSDAQIESYERQMFRKLISNTSRGGNRYVRIFDV